LTASLYLDKVSLMPNTTPEIWETPNTKQLIAVLSHTVQPQNMQNLLRDILTPKEIIEISARLEAARLLANGTSYAQVTALTKLSSRTVARISSWLKQGTGGYTEALALLDGHHPSPTREQEV
jgi:uncharacterized protein YerC